MGDVEPFGRMGSVRGGRRKAPRRGKRGRGTRREGLSRALFFSRETFQIARACMYYTHPTPAGTVRTTERPDHSTVENAPPLRRVVPVRRRARGVDGSSSQESLSDPPSRGRNRGVGSVALKHPRVWGGLINTRVGDRAGACLVTLASSYFEDTSESTFRSGARSRRGNELRRPTRAAR